MIFPDPDPANSSGSDRIRNTVARCTCCSRSELDVKGRVHLDDVCELADPAESGGAGTLHHLAERVAAAEQTRTYYTYLYLLDFTVADPDPTRIRIHRIRVFGPPGSGSFYH